MSGCSCDSLGAESKNRESKCVLLVVLLIAGAGECLIAMDIEIPRASTKRHYEAKYHSISIIAADINALTKCSYKSALSNLRPCNLCQAGSFYKPAGGAILVRLTIAYDEKNRVHVASRAEKLPFSAPPLISVLAFPDQFHLVMPKPP